MSGPIPPPAILEGYDRVQPGTAARILNWAETDQTHQREMEKLALEAFRLERKRSQIFAFGSCVVLCATAAACAFAGAHAAAGVIGGTTVVGIVIAFLGKGKPEKG